MKENNDGLYDPLNDIDSPLEIPLTSPEGYSLEDDDDEQDNFGRRRNPGNDNYNEGDDEDDDDDNNEEDDEDDEQDEEGSGTDPKRSYPALRLLLEMMVNPVEGWKKIRRTKSTPEETARGCFFPIIAIAAGSAFMECVYNSATTLSMAMIAAVKIFVSLFFGNFLALAFVKMLMPADEKKIADSVFGKKYMMYLLSTLGLFVTLYELLPMIGPILSFTPLWTIYLAMRGARFFRFPEEKSSLLTAVMCGIVVAAPFLVYWVFDLLLPDGHI